MVAPTLLPHLLQEIHTQDTKVRQHPRLVDYGVAPWHGSCMTAQGLKSVQSLSLFIPSTTPHLEVPAPLKVTVHPTLLTVPASMLAFSPWLSLAALSRYVFLSTGRDLGPSTIQNTGQEKTSKQLNLKTNSSQQTLPSYTSLP